jgi:hypothetical protein
MSDPLNNSRTKNNFPKPLLHYKKKSSPWAASPLKDSLVCPETSVSTIILGRITSQKREYLEGHEIRIVTKLIRGKQKKNRHTNTIDF